MRPTISFGRPDYAAPSGSRWIPAKDRRTPKLMGPFAVAALSGQDNIPLNWHNYRPLKMAPRRDYIFRMSTPTGKYILEIWNIILFTMIYLHTDLPHSICELKP
jgi:hypothetical protein